MQSGRAADITDPARLTHNGLCFIGCYNQSFGCAARNSWRYSGLGAMFFMFFFGLGNGN